MDNASLFIGLILLATFILPVIYILIVQHLKEKRYKNLIKKIALENHLKLDKMEFYYPFCLALDRETKKFLVTDLREDNSYDIINLKDVRKIRLSVNHALATPDMSKKEKIFHLSLCIENKMNSGTKEITLYDENDETSTDGDIRLNEARKFDDLLQQALIA